MRILKKKTRVNKKDFHEKYLSDEMYSDCCGVETTETDMGICPDCLEHCEFIGHEE